MNIQKLCFSGEANGKANKQINNVGVRKQIKKITNQNERIINIKDGIIQQK